MSHLDELADLVKQQEAHHEEEMNKHITAAFEHEQAAATAHHEKKEAIAEHHRKQVEMTEHLNSRLGEHDARVEEHKSVAEEHKSENEALKADVKRLEGAKAELEETLNDPKAMSMFRASQVHEDLVGE